MRFDLLCGEYNIVKIKLRIYEDKFPIWRSNKTLEVSSKSEVNFATSATVERQWKFRSQKSMILVIHYSLIEVKDINLLWYPGNLKIYFNKIL